jgi:transposase-like protein
LAKEYPETLLEFEHWFRSEEGCREYLRNLRWPNGFICPSCGNARAWTSRRGLLHCSRCRKDTSVTSGTIFHRSRLPLRVWFRAAWWLTNQKNGVSALGLQRLLGLGSYETAWRCLHKLRSAMIRPGRQRLRGDVEVDETFIGGRRKGSSGIGKKTGVAIAAEVRGEGTGRIRLRPLTTVDSHSLREFVESAVEPGSRLITDGHRDYSALKWAGYDHRPTVLSGHGKEASTAVLPRVHRVAALLKRWLLGTYHGRVTTEQLGSYLDEFTFRFNRRTSEKRGLLFYRLMQQCVAIPLDAIV